MIRIVVLCLVEVSGSTPWFDSVCGYAKKSFLNDFFFIFLSSYHEKATEALCVGRIQTRLEVAFVSKFSA